METYLYGAAVQGIQSFIFQTNKLKEIVGASELVEEICTTKFASLIFDQNLDYTKAKEKLSKDNNAILFAAGNIKYIFQSKEECEQIVRIFPKEISQFAPGITVSQAVVKMDGKDFENAVNLLETRLRTQRNIPMQSQTIGLMGILRSRQTGLPVVGTIDGELSDAARIAKLKTNDETNGKNTTLNLCKKAFGMDKISDRTIALNVENMTGNNDWIAIIHADGNGLGQIVQKVGRDAEEFKKFSQNLDIATTQAAVTAYQYIVEKYHINEEDVIPIRPIVLGGDDLTFICRADFALEYTKVFIEEFEKITKEKLGKQIIEHKIFTGDVRDRLTACAGIAYIKSSYPFYYGYELAEALCKRAKKDAKNNINDGELPKSCLMFHKVQDSFTEDWKSICDRELTPQKELSFEFGPYYISEKKDATKWLVTDLMVKVKELEGKEGNAVKSHLRNWMSLLHDNEGMAKQKMNRLLSLYSGTKLETCIKEVTKWEVRANKRVCPVYDILTIHTINNQKTR